MNLTSAGHRQPPAVDLSTLLRLFYDDSRELGEFEAVTGDEVPEPFNQLLNHHSHMTVTVEAFHASPVDVRVARTKTEPPWYAREITLVTQTAGKLVQYGIVRLNFEVLGKTAWRQIESQSKPLGRILIEQNVLRQVELCQLWRVRAGVSLARQLEIPEGTTVYGRTARIFCNGAPAIELLEIVVAD